MEKGEVVKEFISKKGNKVIFRAPREDDLEQMLLFVNELIREQVYVAVGADGKELTIEEEKEYLDKILSEIEKGKALHLLGLADQIQVASCSLIKGEGRRAHVGLVGIAILKNFRSEGIGTEFLNIIIQKAKETGLKILELKVYGPNQHAINLYQKLGFKEIGRGEGMIKHKDEFLDEVWMALRLGSG